MNAPAPKGAGAACSIAEGLIPTAIIGGGAGSPAEAFANANGIKFEVVGSSDEEIKAWFSWQEPIDESCGSGVFYETSDGELVEYDKDNLPF